MVKVNPAVQPRNQPTSTSCWYTCLQMLFDWKKKDSSKIIETMDQSPNLFPDYMLKNGIAPSECKETAKILGLGFAGDGDTYPDVMANALRSHGPYWVAGMWTKNSSHVIVVTSCDPETGAIRYINPWNNFDLSDSPGDIDWLNARGSVWKQTLGSMMYWV